MELILECVHGEPRGERYCALCRITKQPKPEIDRNYVAVHKNAQETSKLAAGRALPSSGTKRRITFELIKESGMFGLCDHELEEKTGWLHQSASAARNTLMKDGWIIDSGLRRNTPQGNPAIVWITNKEM
jgi:hypothetical protein